MTKKVLIVVTNADKLADGTQTGVWLEEFAVPFLIFRDTGYEITVASIKGGKAPIDEGSLSCSNPMEWDEAARLSLSKPIEWDYFYKFLENTKKLEEVDYKNFDAIFFPGGHGPMFDIAENELVAEVTGHFYNTGKATSAVCHGPAGLLGEKRTDGEPIVKNKRVTSFTNEEENIVKRTELVPFLLQSRLEQLGAEFTQLKPWAEHVIVDDNLITGQNPASAIAVAEKVIEYLNQIG